MRNLPQWMAEDFSPRCACLIMSETQPMKLILCLFRHHFEIIINFILSKDTLQSLYPIDTCLGTDIEQYFFLIDILDIFSSCWRWSQWLLKSYCKEFLSISGTYIGCSTDSSLLSELITIYKGMALGLSLPILESSACMSISLAVCISTTRLYNPHSKTWYWIWLLEWIDINTHQCCRYTRRWSSFCRRCLSSYFGT